MFVQTARHLVSARENKNPLANRTKGFENCGMFVTLQTAEELPSLQNPTTFEPSFGVILSSPPMSECGGLSQQVR